jgi:outer membrane receptor protein involved in Fe transport
MQYQSTILNAPGGRRPLCVALSLALSLAYAGQALAQTQEAMLKETTVSSETDKPVQQRTELGKLTPYTPISGAVVDKEEIEHLQLVNNLLELGKRVPGISMVRNMRIPDGGKLYTENRIDGMRATATNTSILDEVDMADIERIEVITGPGSALYGSGALGGTINVFTRQPPPNFRAKLSQEVGSWGFQRTQGNIGTGFAEGRASFIVTGSNMDNDGWRQSSAPGAQNAAAEHKDGQTVRAQFRPTDSTKLTVGYGQLRYDYRWAGSLAMTKFDQDWRQTEAGTYGQSIDEYKTTSLRVQQLVGERGEFTLAKTRITDDSTANGSSGSGGSNSVICDDSGALNAGLGAGKSVKCRAVNNNIATSTNTLKKGASVTETTMAMYRQEFDVAKATAYVGAELIDISSDSATYNNTFNALQAQSGQWAQGAMTTTGQGAVTGSKETTPFVHLEFSPLEKLRFHIGERFATIAYAVNDRTVANKDVAMEREGNVLRAGVTYEINKSHLVWANWGETFNPQSTGSLLDSALIGTAGRTIGATLAPERGVTQEIGVRGRFQELGLQYDLTYYDALTQGFNTTRSCTAAEQVALNGGATCTLNEAAGKLATNGLESTLSWAATSWLDLGATYTNARAYYVDYRTKTVDYTGNSYQAIPRHKLNLRVGVKPAPGWLVELEADHVSDYFVDTENSGTYARPNLFNLRASYRAKDWSFWLHALNITNQQYATRVGYSTIAGVSNVLAASAGQGNSGSYTPLTLRAGVAYNF